jgi:hypothetical protein
MEAQPPSPAGAADVKSSVVVVHQRSAEMLTQFFDRLSENKPTPNDGVIPTRNLELLMLFFTFAQRTMLAHMPTPFLVDTLKFTDEILTTRKSEPILAKLYDTSNRVSNNLQAQGIISACNIAVTNHRQAQPPAPTFSENKPLAAQPVTVRVIVPAPQRKRCADELPPSLLSPPHKKPSISASA